MVAFKELPPYINGFKVIRDLGTTPGGKRRYLIAECKICNKHFDVEKFSLLKKERKGCGCQMPYPHRRNQIRTNIPNSLRNTYTAMIGRCYDSSHMNFKCYGAKGITVCEEWKNDNKVFFKWAIENGYKKGLTLDRMNPSLGYLPENCRFVTMAINIQSRRSNRFNPEKIRQVRKDFLVMTTREVAKKWGTHHRHIMDIKSRKAWANVED